MKLIVNKISSLNGQAIPPSSKSQSIRALILASLCKGESILTNILQADDTHDAINGCKQLGATMTSSSTEPDKIIVTGQGLPLNIDSPEINTGNSGITTHFLMPILGLRNNPEQPIILNCHEQMRARPIKSFVDALSRLGLRIEYLKNENQLPISMSGELVGGKTTVDGTTSQYLSALLFALPCAKSDSEITVKHLQERPYVDMTLEYLKKQGIHVKHQVSGDVDVYQIKGNQKYKKFNSTISSDFSSASYLIAASALLPGEVCLQGLNMSDPQGDKQLVTILQAMGADINVSQTQLIIRGGKKLTGIKIDASDIPDLLPTLAIIGTYAQGKTDIYNVAHARIKETDRIHSIADGLSRLGAKVIKNDDGLTVYQSTLTGSNVNGYGDHRTVMALSIAGMLADGRTVISDSQSINKTFPTFIQIMRSLGACMEVENA